MGLVSCGGSSRRQTSSGLSFRAFISNPVNPTFTGANFPALNIVDATKDKLSPFDVSLLGTSTSAGMMVESPKRDRTVVFSPTTDIAANNEFAIVNNAKESASGSITLPGPTESFFVWSDDTTLYAAIPTEPIAGQPAGAVIQADISKNNITATIPVAGAHYLVPSPSGNQILAISDSANAVTILSPALIAGGGGTTTVTGFDKPVWAVFSSDGSTAYIMNCGPECGGTTASISVLDMGSASISNTVPVPAATTGLLDGGNLYVAGTPVASGVNCQTNLCGVLSVFAGANLAAPPSTFAITDGYHNRMVQASNTQLFIGARTCTNVVGSGNTPGRGCLSVFNEAGGKAYTAAQNGDVTGIEPILQRTVVYVCEGGAIQIYDTAADLGAQQQLQLQKTQVTVTGQAIDVKLADF
jgi:hypothetical protein